MRPTWEDAWRATRLIGDTVPPTGSRRAKPDGVLVRSSGWPRAAVCLLHLLDHASRQVDAAFDTWIFPLLGLIFLPLATLLYAVLWTVGGLSGWAWFWVILAAVLDLAHGATAAASRSQYQSGPPAAA